MANMFDVNQTMSSVADNQIQQMSGIEARVEDISERIDSVKSMVESSMSSIDDSISKIEDVTNNILSSAQDSLQEQQNQIQIMESEKEADEMKFKGDTGSQEDPNFVLSRLSKMLEDLKFSVKNILDEKSVSGSNIKDIDAGDKITLKIALSTIFGASVLGYLFQDSGGSEEKGGSESGDSSSAAPAEQQNNEQQSESENSSSDQEKESSIQESTQSKSENISPEKEESSVQESPNKQSGAGIENQIKGDQESSVTPVSNITDTSSIMQDALKQNLDSPRMNAESKNDPIYLRNWAIEKKELVKTPDIYYYPDGSVVELRDVKDNRIQLLVEAGADVYEKALMEDTPDNRKKFPGLWDNEVPMISSNAPSTGERLQESNKQVEKAEDTTRSNIAQNLVTVVNQAAPEPEKTPPKNTAVVGKVTLDKILR